VTAPLTDTGTSAGPARSYHAIGGAEPEPVDVAVRARRAAIDELGGALRELVELTSANEAPTEELLRVAALVREAAAPLARHPRARAQMPSADDLMSGVRMFNPVSGTGSAMSPPVLMELAGDEVVGTCTLGLAFEGPPMYAHGGVSALLLDQLLGYATSASGHPGMTVALTTQYRKPVPLQTPLRLTAKVTTVEGRKVTALGTITTAADPAAVLVEATGTFVALNPEQATRLFAAALHPDATDPTVAHG
jgi:acyl-CoA thioesterase FadM